MKNFKLYEVGGKVRDELLGLKPKDVDYTAVPDETILSSGYSAEQMFTTLVDELHDDNFEVFLIHSESYTIRARFPEDYKYQGVADFVMARKEIAYIEGTRTPVVVPGNLYDDLSRRDFTVNALAKDPDTGEIIDYFNGLEDLKNKILRTPLDPVVTFNDDPLRRLRALRFVVTKGFEMEDNTYHAAVNCNNLDSFKVVSEERIREELYKCFKHNTQTTMYYLTEHFYDLWCHILRTTNLWLKPTNEN